MEEPHYRGFRKKWRDVIKLHPGTAQGYNTTTANGGGHARQMMITSVWKTKYQVPAKEKEIHLTLTNTILSQNIISKWK